MALISVRTASRLEFLGKLALAGRCDVIARRLLGRKALGTVQRPFDPARHAARGVVRRPPQQPWRIAAFVHETALSGAPISLVELATVLVERRLAQVQVLAPSEGPITAASRKAGLDVAIHGVELRDLLTRRRWAKAAAHLADVMRAFAPDIVHANSVMTAPALAAAHICGVPALLNVREDRPEESFFGFLPQDVATEAFETLRAADEIVFVSQASRDGWRPYFAAETCHLVVNALRRADAAANRATVRAQLGIDDATMMVLAVGSYCERKGQADLVDAIGRLDDAACRRLRVVMIGEAEPVYLGELERRIERLGAGRRSALSLLPAQPQPQSFYRAADVFVCCSRSESYPRVTIEAMGAGLPIVTTPVAGIVEQLTSEEALFYPPGDVAALAQHIVRLAEEPGLRAKFAARAAAAYDRHADFDAMVDGYVQAYRRALGEVPRGDQDSVKL